MKAAERVINERFYSVDVLRDSIARSVRVLASTKPAPHNHQWITQKLQSTDCYWTTSRWARLIKWFLKGKYRRKFIPYPLECLAYATEVALEPSTFTLPESVWDSIYAQAAEIHMQNQEVMVILLGRSAYVEVVKSRHFSMFPIITDEGTDRVFEIEGMHTVVTPKLAHDAVIVIPR